MEFTHPEEWGIEAGGGEEGRGRNVPLAIFEVVVVMGKGGDWGDNLGAEAMSRMGRLVSHILERGWPSLICITGSKPSRESPIPTFLPSSHIHFMYFKKICRMNGVEIPTNVDFLLCGGDNIGESMSQITSKVTSMVSSVLSKSSAWGGVHVNFSLVSSCYHLCNLNDIHLRSPRRSVLSPLTSRVISAVKEHNLLYGTHPQDGIIEDSSYGNLGNSGKAAEKRGVVTVEFITVPYLFLDSQNVCTEFLANCFLKGQQLVPILVNIQGVVHQKEFFQRDNYNMLSDIRRELVVLVDKLHKPCQEFVTGFNLSRYRTKDNAKDVVFLDDILDEALVCLGRCVDLVRPAGSLSGTVSMSDWVTAKSELELGMAAIRTACDADIPVEIDRWGQDLYF